MIPAPGLGGSSDPSLSAPIRVRRPQRWRRRILWAAAVAGLLAAGLVLLRVAAFSYPVIRARVKPPEDGWRLLRGITHVVVDPADEGALRRVLDGAFANRLDFLLLAEPGGLTLARRIADAPLAVVHAQQVDTRRGCFLAVGLGRAISADQAASARIFERIRRLGGWSMVVRPLSRDCPWTAWDDPPPDVYQFLDAATRAEDLPPEALLVRWAGVLLGSEAAYDHLGRRSISALARWDDFNRHGPVPGLCGSDGGAGGLRMPLTYVSVPDGLGPYGPAEIARALRQGHSFCALPIYGDPTGFRYQALATDGGAVLGRSGDTVELGRGIELVADLHLASSPDDLLMTVLYRDGNEVARKRSPRLAQRVDAAGAYRVEVRVEVPGLWFETAERLFVVSNPIFVQD